MCSALKIALNHIDDKKARVKFASLTSLVPPSAGAPLTCQLGEKRWNTRENAIFKIESSSRVV